MNILPIPFYSHRFEVRTTDFFIKRKGSGKILFVLEKENISSVDDDLKSMSYFSY